MQLTVLKPGEEIAKATVSQVTLPCASGQITPMEGHDRLLSTTDGGPMYFFRSDAEQPVKEEYEISSGIIEVMPDSVVLFVESAKRIKGGDLEG